MTSECSEEYERLSVNLQQVEDKVTNQWMGSETDGYLETQISVAQEQIRKSKEEMAKLKEVMSGLQDQAKNNQRVIEERREKTKALRESLSDVKKETDDILRDKEVKEAALENLLHEIGSTKELMEAQEKATSQSLQELTTSAQWFEDRLALRFKKLKGNELQFIFTCIDKADPSRPFYFSLNIDSNKKYQVLNCDPPVTDLSEIVDKLNLTNNLRAFTITMRKRFKETT